MTRMLVVSAPAETDLAEATAWYNRIRPRLGDDLVLCVEHALDRILEHPEAFPMILPDVRRALVRRFPYGVFFRLRQQRIEVEAVFHLRTDPARCWERLDSAPRQDSCHRHLGRPSSSSGLSARLTRTSSLLP